MKSFWDKKNILRRYLSFKNRTLFVLEKIAEKEDISISEAIEKVVNSSAKYHESLSNLERDYPDIKGDKYVG